MPTGLQTTFNQYQPQQQRSPRNSDSSSESLSPDSNLQHFKQELEDAFTGFRWPWRSLTTYDSNGLSFGPNPDEQPLSRDLLSVGKVLDGYIVSCLNDLYQERRVEVVEAGARQYPDTTLEGEDVPADRIALDIKTGMRASPGSNALNSRVVVGTHGRYFNNPDKKTAGILHPYNSYTHHWVLLFIYSVNEDYQMDDPDSRLITNIEVVVDDKWRLATTEEGSGTRDYIASPKTVSEIVNRDGDFTSRAEFLEYWLDEPGETDTESQTEETTHQQRVSNL